MLKEEKMSKNKFIKSLLALGISAVSAVSAFGMAACNPTSGGGGGNPKKLTAPTIAYDSATKKITWKAVDHATGYNVYEQKGEAAAVSKSNAQAACEYTVTQMLEGTYQYYVIATSTDEAYSDSDISNKVTVNVAAQMFTVTFETGATGSKIDPVQVKGGQTVSKPVNDPTNTDATKIFDGWYTTNAYAQTVDWSLLITDNTTYYAKWRDATKYDELLAETAEAPAKLLVNETFSTTTSVPAHDGFGTKGVWQAKKEATGSENRVDVANGVATLVDTAGGHTELIIDFGHAKGTVKGYFETKLSGSGNGWTLFQLYGSDTAKTNAEVFGVRTDGGKFKYRLDGGSISSDVVGAGTVADDVLYKVYYEVNLTNSTVTFDVNGEKVADAVAVAGLNGVQGLKLVTSDSGSKTFSSVDQIIVVGEEQTPAEYAEQVKGNLTDKYPSASLTSAVLGDLSTGVSDLLTSEGAKITAATTFTAIDDAYKSAVTAVDTLILGNAKTAADGKIDNLRSGEQITTNAEALATAKSTGKANVGNATTVKEVEDAYTAAETAINAIENDTAAAKADIALTVTGKVEGEADVALGTINLKSGDVKTADEIKALLNVSSLYTLEGLYSDEACTTAITSYSKTSDTDTTDTIYAKLIKQSTTPVGTYTMTCVSNNASVAGPAGADTTGMFAFADKNGNATSGNAGDFKMDGGAAVITVKFKVEAGQTVKLTVKDVYSGSSTGTCGVGVTSSANLTTSDALSKENIAKDPKENLIINFVANAGGDVTLMIKRVGGSTTRITAVELVIANPAA